MTRGKPAGELGKDYITVTRPSGKVEYWLNKMKEKIKKFVDKLQQLWNKLLYKLMFKKYK